MVDGFSILHALLALCLVIGLMVGISMALRYFIGDKLNLAGRSGKRLSVREVHYITPKTKLFLIARDDTEHLILSGPNGDHVIERNIHTHQDLSKNEHSHDEPSTHS